MFTRKIGIDLGTANTIIFVPGKGFIINEPTIVALSLPDSSVLAVGREAKGMIGRVPDDIKPYQPLRDGVIADYYITRAMLKYFISSAIGQLNFFRPEVVISAPAGITQTERRAVINAAREAGAKEVHIVREPILAALGAGIPINARSGSMIINMGGGTTETAIISLGGIVSWSSIRVAGNKFDVAISDFLKKKYNIIIGDQTAEAIKIEIGSALPMKNKLSAQVRGRDSITGLPKDIVITSNEVAEAIHPHLLEIASAVKKVFNETPPELIADVMNKGIILSGGSSQILHLPEFFKRIFGVNAFLAEDPFFCVARGSGIILNHLDVYKRTLLNKR